MKLRVKTYIEHRAAGENDARMNIFQKALGFVKVMIPGASSTSTIGGCSCCSCGAPTALPVNINLVNSEN